MSFLIPTKFSVWEDQFPTKVVKHRYRKLYALSLYNYERISLAKDVILLIHSGLFCLFDCRITVNAIDPVVGVLYLSVILLSLFSRLCFFVSFIDVSRPFGRSVYRFGRPNSGAQITLFKFCFFTCISVKDSLK